MYVIAKFIFKSLKFLLDSKPLKFGENTLYAAKEKVLNITNLVHFDKP